MGRLAAGVRKRTDGTLEKRFTINGKRYSVYGKSTKELTTKEQDIRKQIEAGTYTENRNITLDEYFEEWLKNKRQHNKSNTLKTYTCYYKKHISPRLGKKKVQQIERREILLLQSDLTSMLSAVTTNGILKTLKIILNDAMHEDIIIKNPAAGVKSLKETTKATETYHRALAEEEQQIFMREIENDYYYEFIALLLCSGMRSGEVAALTWDDIDYKNNVIHVTKTMTFTEKGVLIVGNSPKSEAGKRDIPLTKTIKDILQRQRGKCNIISMDNRKIFTAIYGGQIYNGEINRAISDALERLEKKGIHIEHFTAHALRDTFATRFIEQGGQPQTLKTILGHSSLAMTMDLYAHVLPNTKQKEMDNLHIAL